jgi:hypothetical protein
VGANNAGNIENVFAASLKNGVHQLIISVSVEVANEQCRDQLDEL